MFRTKVPRQERARKRAAVGPLQQTLVRPATLRAYQHSLKIFYLWLGVWALEWPFWAASAACLGSLGGLCGQLWRPLWATWAA